MIIANDSGYVHQTRPKYSFLGDTVLNKMLQIQNLLKCRRNKLHYYVESFEMH